MVEMKRYSGIDDFGRTVYRIIEYALEYLSFMEGTNEAYIQFLCFRK